MPYGSHSDNQGSTLKVERVYYGVSSSRSYSFVTVMSYWVRSGSRTARDLLQAALSRRYTYVLIQRWVKTGRYRWVTYRDRTTRKLVRYRVALKVLQTRLVKKRVSRRGNALRGLNLPSNTLNYQKTEISDYDRNLSWSANWSPGDQTYKLQGDLLQAFDDKPLGSNQYFVEKSPSDYAANLPPDLLSKELEVGDRAYSRLLSKLRDEKVNVAQCFAERKQTFSLISDIAVRVARGFANAKRGNVSGALSSIFPTNLKELGSDVLAFDFGVRPLLSDIHGLVAFIQQKEAATDRGTDFISRDKYDLPPTTVYSAISNDWVYCKTEVIQSGSVEVKYKLTFAVDSRIVTDAKSLGLTDPLALAWEVTPWSFVADWLLPIGTFIADLSSLTGLRYVRGHRTVTYKMTTVFRRTFGGIKSVQNFTGPRMVVETRCEHVRVARSLLTEPPSTPLPHTRNPFTGAHMRDALSLILQRRS